MPRLASPRLIVVVVVPYLLLIRASERLTNRSAPQSASHPPPQSHSDDDDDGGGGGEDGDAKCPINGLNFKIIEMGRNKKEEEVKLKQSVNIKSSRRRTTSTVDIS